MSFCTLNNPEHVNTLPVFLFFRLTDDESRENWEKYGNPDGPTGTYQKIEYWEETIIPYCWLVEILK